MIHSVDRGDTQLSNSNSPKTDTGNIVDTASAQVRSKAYCHTIGRMGKLGVEYDFSKLPVQKTSQCAHTSKVHTA